jgi:hypothetical protein
VKILVGSILLTAGVVGLLMLHIGKNIGADQGPDKAALIAEGKRIHEERRMKAERAPSWELDCLTVHDHKPHVMRCMNDEYLLITVNGQPILRWHDD